MGFVRPRRAAIPLGCFPTGRTFGGRLEAYLKEIQAMRDEIDTAFSTKGK